MSAHIHAAGTDIHEVLSGLRQSLPSIADVIEATTVLCVSAFLTLSLNILL